MQLEMFPGAGCCYKKLIEKRRLHLYREEILQISTAQADDPYTQHKACELGSKNILLFYV